MEKQADGELFHVLRLDEFFVDIKLNDGDPAQHVPRDELWEGSVRQGIFFAENHKHFGRGVATSAPSQPLQKTRYLGRRAELNDAFEPSDVDAELHCHRRTCDAGQIALQPVLRFLAYRRGKIAVMNEENVVVAAQSAKLMHCCADVLRFFARIGKNYAFLSA